VSEGQEDLPLDDVSLLQTGLQKVPTQHAPAEVWHGAATNGSSHRRIIALQLDASQGVGDHLLHSASQFAAFTDAVLVHSSKASSKNHPDSFPMIWVFLGIGILVAVIVVIAHLQLADSSDVSSGYMEDLLRQQETSSAKASLVPHVPEGQGPQARSSRQPVQPTTSLAPLPPTSGGPSTAATMLDVSTGPPPICTSLILPNTEARFMVNMDALLSLTTGSLDILGTSGRKLLHASVEDLTDGRRRLLLASDGCEGDPRAIVYTPAPAEAAVGSSAAPQLQVFGRGSRPYGHLEVGYPGAVLHCQGVPVMHLEVVSLADFRMKALAMNGRELATAGRSAGGRRQAEGGSSVWKVSVRPGVDAVLISSCMLSLGLLLPQQARASLQAGESPVWPRSELPSISSIMANSFRIPGSGTTGDAHT